MGSLAASGVKRLGLLVAQPFIRFGSWYNNTAKRNPVTCGIITSGLKTSAADVFAQKVVERRDEMDWKRHAVFCVFGFTYLGGFQYWLYNVKFTQWCGTIHKYMGHVGTAPVKTAIDQLIHHPFCYFPVFFTLKTLIDGKPLSAAYDKYRAEIWDSCKALWSVWVPGQLFNFAFVPRHLRVPFVAGISFAWCIILSVMQGKLDRQSNRQTDTLPVPATRDIDDVLDDRVSHHDSALNPAVKPISAPTFASGAMVPTAIHGTAYQHVTSLRKV